MNRDREGRRPEETEIKLPCADLDSVRENLRGQGATLREERHAEHNVLYDDARGDLSGRNCTLRLRTARSEVILTFKGPARFDAGLKVREEREVRVSDASEAAAILCGVGLVPRFRYEKHRESWEHGGCVVSLDETPIGRFLEIEGNPAAIRRIVSDLGLDFSEAIPYSYPSLYARRRREDPSLPPDMLFGP
ncbi:MAG: class IV adenylate cyclase [Thermoanaerobaculia bacterium]